MIDANRTGDSIGRPAGWIRVFVAGPPCSGKSAAGAVLAGLLGLPFADLDRLVERAVGTTVPEIFRTRGEAGFRAAESACLAEAVGGGGEFVMALGGGTLLDPENLGLVLAAGIVVTLLADPAALAARMSAQRAARPLSGDAAALLRLLEDRRAHYAALPNPVDTSGMTVTEAAEAAAAVVRRALLS